MTPDALGVFLQFSAFEPQTVTAAMAKLKQR